MTSVDLEEADRARPRPRPRIVHILPLVPIFLIALFASSPIRDNSFFWHIRVGELQLADQLVAVTDPFSISLRGTAWRTQSWLIELLYAKSEAMFSSFVWVNVFVFIVGLTTAGIVAVAVYKSSPSAPTAAGALAVMVWLGGPFLQPRPVLVSYVLLALLVVVLQRRDQLLWLAVPIIWIWAGIHGSWAIGGLLVVLELLRTRDARLLKAGIAALAATFLTAHGAGAWQILLDFGRARGTLSQFQEWMPPDFGDIIQAPYLLLFVGIVVAALKQRITARDLIVILPFLFLGMTSRRFVFPAAIVVIPWAALAMPALKIPKSSMSPRFVGIVMASIAMMAVGPLMVSELGVIDESRFPDEALLVEIEGRALFHDDAVGGFLIFAEWPDRFVYIDDRAELYGEEYFRTFVRARAGEYEDLFEEFGFDAALVRPSWTLSDRLERDGWLKKVETDDLILYLRPGDR